VNSLKPDALEPTGKELARNLSGHLPIVYASRRNIALAFTWKIKFNETGKTPAFYNTLPEANHNEMTGFDVKDGTRALSSQIHFLFLKDNADHPRIQKRMEVLEKLYRDRKLPVENIEINGTNRLEKIFRSLILADWVSYHLALKYGVEPEEVPMVEEFKRLIA
jgi:glucose/mannose-6-phosphate isomerase